jgi:hypothetical protein
MVFCLVSIQKSMISGWSTTQVAMKCGHHYEELKIWNAVDTVEGEVLCWGIIVDANLNRDDLILFFNRVLV